MRGLGNTIARLSKLRRAADAHMKAAGDGHLREMDGFGSNPGGLRALLHIPTNLTPGAPLVVALHGCTQTAAGYDRGAGWSALADREGFAVLFPEQRRANNHNLCFNWYSPSDARRGRGEALSIKQMIAKAVETHGLDPSRVHVTGLSAGGAMASVMLATYPELFAGGAIVAGLPFGDADSVSEALTRMRGQGGAGHGELAGLVARASKHKGPWPRISVWHGTNDATVVPANADAIVAQWRPLHGVHEAPDKMEAVNGHSRKVWTDADGREVIEHYAINGMGHGTPVRTLDAGAGPYALAVGLSSTERTAQFWGLAGAEGKALARPAAVQAQPRPRHAAKPAARRPIAAVKRPSDAKEGVARVIEDALRAAGLMR